MCRPWLSRLGVVVAVVSALAFRCPDAHADAKAGEEKAQLCLLCHRVERGAAPTLEQQPSEYLVAQTNAFKTGKRNDPIMQTNVARLSAKDIQDISDYLSSQRAKPARFPVEPDRASIEGGAALAQELGCGSCHGDGFQGANDVPRLAAQVPNYLERQIVGFKKGMRAHPAIPAAAHRLDDRAIDALVAYLGTLAP